MAERPGAPDTGIPAAYRDGRGLASQRFRGQRERFDSLRLLFRLVIDLAGRKGKTGVRGWLPNEPAIRSLFDLQPRTESITMVKSLDAGLKIEERHLLTADRFCKIDHV